MIISCKGMISLIVKYNKVNQKCIKIRKEVCVVGFLFLRIDWLNTLKSHHYLSSSFFRPIHKWHDYLSANKIKRMHFGIQIIM